MIERLHCLACLDTGCSPRWWVPGWLMRRVLRRQNVRLARLLFRKCPWCANPKNVFAEIFAWKMSEALERGVDAHMLAQTERLVRESDPTRPYRRVV